MHVDTTTAYRHAKYDTPWWVNENRNEGRYNRAGQYSTQYLCLHPLGVSAEFLRHLGEDAVADLKQAEIRLWAMQVDMNNVERIDFANSSAHGLTAEQLVGDDYSPTQSLADELRGRGVNGLIAPSAALPGTEILVLFGPRVALPYLGLRLDDDQVATAHALDGPPASEVASAVRWFGTPHEGLEEWKRTGTVPSLEEPWVTR